MTLPTIPKDDLLTAVRRLEIDAFRIGYAAALSRFEMLAAIDPDTITKADLAGKLRREIDACKAAINQN